MDWLSFLFGIAITSIVGVLGYSLFLLKRIIRYHRKVSSLYNHPAAKIIELCKKQFPKQTLKTSFVLTIMMLLSLIYFKAESTILWFCILRYAIFLGSIIISLCYSAEELWVIEKMWKSYRNYLFLRAKKPRRFFIREESMGKKDALYTIETTGL